MWTNSAYICCGSESFIFLIEKLLKLMIYFIINGVYKEVKYGSDPKI